MKRTLVFVCLLLPGASIASSEEAIDLTGRRRQGHLVHENATWFFRDAAGKPIAAKELSHVRFEPKTSLAPTIPLTRTLLLPGGQRLAGSLLKVDEQSLEFASTLGKIHRLRREQVVGITHADDWLPIVHEDFETALKSWKVDGGAERDAKVRFFGSHSLKLNQMNQALTREWPALRDGRVSLAFARPAKMGRWQIEVLAPGTPTVSIDGDGIRAAGLRDSFGTLEVGSSWHSLIVEWQASVLRIYVDDRCLGQTPLPEKAGVAGIRFANRQAGGELFIDELIVARRMRPLPIPKNDPVQDSIWLEHGEQLFGRIVSADHRSIVLDAKFGKRTFSWSQVRGIGFAEGKRPSSARDVEIEFRPGSGCSPDRLDVKLLRWNDAKLIVQHPALGEVAIERARLETVRFAVK